MQTAFRSLIIKWFFYVKRSAVKVQNCIRGVAFHRFTLKLTIKFTPTIIYLISICQIIRGDGIWQVDIRMLCGIVGITHLQFVYIDLSVFWCENMFCVELYTQYVVHRQVNGDKRRRVNFCPYIFSVHFPPGFLQKSTLNFYGK